MHLHMLTVGHIHVLVYIVISLGYRFLIVQTTTACCTRIRTDMYMSSQTGWLEQTYTGTTVNLLQLVVAVWTRGWYHNNSSMTGLSVTVAGSGSVSSVSRRTRVLASQPCQWLTDYLLTQSTVKPDPLSRTGLLERIWYIEELKLRPITWPCDAQIVFLSHLAEVFTDPVIIVVRHPLVTPSGYASSQKKKGRHFVLRPQRRRREWRLWVTQETLFDNDGE